MVVQDAAELLDLWYGSKLDGISRHRLVKACKVIEAEEVFRHKSGRACLLPELGLITCWRSTLMHLYYLAVLTIFVLETKGVVYS